MGHTLYKHILYILYQQCVYTFVYVCIFCVNRRIYVRGLAQSLTHDGWIDGLWVSSCLTLCNPMDCSKSGSSVHGIFQAKILEWVAITSSTLTSHY